MKILNRFSIRTKLFLAYSTMFLLIFPLSFSLLYLQFEQSLSSNIETELRKANKIIGDMVETTTTVSIRNHLRATAENNLQIITAIHNRHIRGELSALEAKQQATALLRSQTIGTTGYIYCIDSTGTFRVHPRSGVQGKSFAHRRFIQEQVALKTGYLEYLWKNPNEASERSKALYMSYFEPWDWIISVSSYKDEFFELINIEDFRDKILDLTFGTSGYTFVLDSRGELVIHPKISGNLLQTSDAGGDYIFQEMINRKNGSLYYWWQNPSEELARKKYVAYTFLPDFGWIVASSIYAEEVFAPLVRAKKLFAIILISSLVITALVTLLISATLLTPLNSLIRQFNQGEHDWTIRMPQDRRDEIGRLAISFNRFMDNLEAANQKLQEEIIIREDKERQLHIFKEVFNNIVEGICITDESACVQLVNPAFERISGYQAREAEGAHLERLKSDQDDPDFFAAIWEQLRLQGHWSGEIVNHRKDGTVYPELLTISTIENPTSHALHYVAVFHDITELKEKEQQIRHLAYHDPLTNLPNRKLLGDRLGLAIARARRNSSRILILFIDLDNFKMVNDTIGHAMGDILLQQTAGRLRKATRLNDTVARLGGDEFIIMVPDIEDPAEIEAVAKRIQSIFDQPFHLNQQVFHITCSVGMALFPDDGLTPDELLKNADTAMYHSKSQGKDMYHLFASEMEEHLQRRVMLGAALRQAVEKDELEVAFQPRVDSRSGRTICLEALARWTKGDGTRVPPNIFIPLAEESGLIVSLGQRILERAIRDFQTIEEQTGRPLRLSVNVSSQQFSDQGFQEMLSTCLEQTGLSPAKLELEITESLLMESKDAAQPLLAWLDQQQIMLAVDDFGTGYSSMAYLKKLPISVLKIDKSFIDDILTDSDSRTIVETIILMATKLNLGLVAEGVESQEQLACLQKSGCNEIQGYLFSPPLPTAACIDFINSEQG
ncbi:bifunctional diguanylate cyclase/phosphodiesterase [Desulfogranum mediterraneum]|uniref:bifunctional diguanylate cyclase/phosphodiesterase n=1 Tax=Desulfogranum mediterraneum TaxID=160661 RepID=UPI0004249AF7|nr:EAL domain-containing protein [Desulfogranum mediterraneum]